MLTTLDHARFVGTLVGTGQEGATMGRPIGKLTALQVSKATKPGMYADGGGLWLQVTSRQAKSWIFRYMTAGRAREMGLGSLSVVTLAAARQMAATHREQRQAGLDPIQARAEQKARAALDAANATTFREAATRYIETHKAGWKAVKHADQWTATLETHAYPAIGDLPVQAIDTGHVLTVLEPIWRTIPETAGRVRGRIESVLDWARVRGMRTGENPARWRGHLSHLLPARSKVRKVKHFAALPYKDVPAFMERLRTQEGVGALALEWTILTVARTGMTIGATWPEIDLEAGLWTIPGNRMKGEKEHRVPLCARAVEIARRLHELRTSDYVFPGGKRGRPLSNMAMSAVLDRMGVPVTVHGYRSTFRDWTAERTSFPNHIAEMALAHAIGDDVEAAYRRGDMLEHREKLMSAWADYCATAPAEITGNVVTLRAG
jgi:integrase